MEFDWFYGGSIEAQKITKLLLDHEKEHTTSELVYKLTYMVIAAIVGILIWVFVIQPSLSW